MQRFPHNAAVLAFLITAPLAPTFAAQAQGTEISTVWTLYESPEVCSMGGKPGGAFVFLTINPEAEQGLIVHHPAIVIDQGEARRAVLTIGDTRLDLDVRGARTTDGVGVIVRERRDLREALAAGPTATLTLSPGATVELDLTGLSEALPLLDSCTDQLRARNPDKIAVVKPKPTRMPNITPSQLPLDGAIQREVGFRLTVSDKGKVDDCEITRSSGSEQLDSKVCQLLTAGARFAPARNAAEKPVAGTFQSRVVF